MASPDQRRAVGTGAQQPECVPGRWGIRRPLACSLGWPGCPRLVPSKPEDGGEAGQSPDAPWEPSTAGWSPGWGRVGQTPHPPAGEGGQRPPGLSGTRARGQQPPAPPSVALLLGAWTPPSVPPVSPGGVSLVWAVVRPARGLAWDRLPRALSCLEGGWDGTLCSGPGPGSSSPSLRPSGSPAAGTTDLRRPCSGWRSPPWAGGSHCRRQEGETVHRPAAGEAPESSVHPRRGQIGRGVWFLCPAPDTGHAANTASPGLHVGRGPQDSAAGPAIPSGPVGRRRAICPAQRPEGMRAKFIHPGVESQGPCPEQPTGSPSAHVTGAQNP